MFRVTRHPILGDLRQQARVTLYVDGQPLEAFEGEMIASCLLASGRRFMRLTERTGEPRGVFCGIGRCTDCVMIVDGVPNVRTCVTPVRDGMRVETQRGSGRWGTP